ncbi:hypothetical protein [Desertibaculum subflavum]|uniref:hypothetical protein n=1 Tax=Desertibaculum subflavum TaxID=2268458 RepID=UPI000E660A6C
MSTNLNQTAPTGAGRRFGTMTLAAAAASLAVLLSGCVVVDDNDTRYDRGKKGFHGHHHQHDRDGHRGGWDRGRY